jgi:uncharacterized protein YndB with AHSA1/START domain
MSNVKRLQFHTVIRAPADVIWNVLFGAETYPQWTKAFTEGSYFEGDWEQGSRMRFLAPSGDGMVAEIAESRPNEFISIRHLGTVVNGTEDTESDSVRAWAPAYENYTLSSVEEGTKVVVDQDMAGDYEQYMRDTWAKALELLRQLCEEESAG